jgi:hypothetical protein
MADLSIVDLLQTLAVLLCRHSARIHPQNLVAQPCQLSLMLADDLRLERPIPVPRHIDRGRALVATNRLGARSVPPVPFGFSPASCFSVGAQ